MRGNTAERRKGKRADYLLRYTRDCTIAVVEAKQEDDSAATGLQQAKNYAEILGLKFAYATNGQPLPTSEVTTKPNNERLLFWHLVVLSHSKSKDVPE